MPFAQDPKEKGKLSRRSPAARSGDAISVSAKDGESYPEILKAMKAKVDPQNSGAEVLSIRRTRREEILLALKRGGDVSAFEKALDQAVGQKADVIKDKLREHLEEIMLIGDLGWARSAGSLEDTARATRWKVVAACDHSMPRCGHGRNGDSMYW